MSTKKGLSRANMGKSIKYECVIQILSRRQKHEQVLKFPTHILSAQSGSVTAHKWFDAARGPLWWVGGNYLFIAPVALARWLSRSFLPSRSGSAEPTEQALGHGNPHFSFFVCHSPQSARQQGICSVGLWAAAGLLPDLQNFDSGTQELTKREQSKRKQSSRTFNGLDGPLCPIVHMDSSIWGKLDAVRTRQWTHRDPVNVEYEIQRSQQWPEFRSIRKQLFYSPVHSKFYLYFFSKGQIRPFSIFTPTLHTGVNVWLCENLNHQLS